MKIKPAERLNRINEYYFSRKLKEIRDLNSGGADIINLGIGNPDSEPSASVLESARESLMQPSSHGYQPYTGIFELRSSFSEWYRRQYDVSLNPESEILPLLGSKEGIMHISLAFLNRGDGVLVPDPGYPTYKAAASICGARVVCYGLTGEAGWYPDIEQIEKSDIDGVKIMWVNYPNMPTGTRASDKLFQRLVDFGKRNNIIIVNDNPYSHILNPEPKSLLSFDPSFEVSLELNSLSKSHNMAGWRVGMVAGSAENISSILKIKSNMDSGMFLPVQVAAIEALKLGADWTEEMNSVYRSRKRLVYRILDLLGSEYNVDQSGLFIWSGVPRGNTSSIEFSNMLLNEFGIFITPGSVFGSNGRAYLRTSLCVSEERLLECIKRLEYKNRENRTYE